MNAVTKKPEVVASTAVPQEAPARASGRRRRMLMLSLPLALALVGGYVWLTGGRYESTENANLLQARVSVSAEVGGRVVSVTATDETAVKAGDILFEVDPEPYQIALSKAEAALANARLNVGQLHAAYDVAVANAGVVASDIDYYRSEFDRKKTLSDKGITSVSGFDEARRDLLKAEESEIAAKETVGSARAALGDPAASVDSHPAVLAAMATRDQAKYDLDRTVVRAPADGIVSQAASFKTGQIVSPGAPLFALVETETNWVDANFKETQLTRMAVGQSATVEFDTYPGREFEARIEAIGAGTGASFALLPAQNATGNWVKVTQRIPVRLVLEPAEDMPLLRTGMSVEVTVDTGRTRGAALASDLGGER